MKRKIPRTRLIITALIFGLAAILTTLAQRNAEATPPQASTEFDAIDDYVRGQLDDLRMPGAALGIVKDGEVVHLQTFRDAKDMTDANPIQDRVVEQIVHSPGGRMHLVEAGRDPSTHRTAIPSWVPGRRSREKSRITVRHLLNQVITPTSAGMDYMFPD